LGIGKKSKEIPSLPLQDIPQAPDNDVNDVEESSGKEEAPIA
jgi:hypothetical protein